jgi:hypothetical protein
LWEENKPISFYGWECPPRQIQEDKKYGRWVNFDIDIKSVVQGKKLDKYTELPRLTAQWKQENWFIETLINKNPDVSYSKIIADTNGLYLYKKSRAILGEKKIRKLSKKFQVLLEKRSKKLLEKNSPPIILYSSLQKKFKTEYNMFFNLVYKSFDKKINQIVPQNIINYWMNRMVRHVGLTDKDRKERVDILQRVIASYAAEGMLFVLLNQDRIMPNPVWVNWEEKPESTKTTELLRERYGLKSIPVIYFVKD